MSSLIRTRPEFTVNSFGADDQTDPSVATFADGGFVVTWVTRDPTQDGHGNAIKAQLFDPQGRKVGLEFLVNSAANGEQFTPRVETLADGNFIVTWVTNISDDGTDGIKAQLFSRSGEKIGAEFQVNLSGSSLFEANVTSLADGRFIISWDDWSSRTVKAQIFDPAGGRIGGILTLAADPAQGFGDVIALANGGFVATWRVNGTSWDVKAQVFDSSGAKVGGAFVVNTTVAGSQNAPKATALTGGGFVITWSESNPEYQSGNTRIKAQVHTDSGQKVGGELLVSTTSAYTMGGQVVTALADGGFLVAWDTFVLLSGGGSDSEVRAQRFTAGGAKVDGEFVINGLTAGHQSMPDLDLLADGRIVAVWASDGGDLGGKSVRAQILGTDLAEPLPNERPIIISNGGGTSASLIQDEGVAAVTTVVASDDGEPSNLRYSITGGFNADLFTINALTGALAFITPPDHVEGADNFYTVTVTASDGELTSFQSIQISVRHVNSITIVSDGGYDWAELWIDENQTGVTVVSAVDEDGLPLNYSITGGEHADFFTIDSATGELRFTAAPDYELPGAYGNSYSVEVTASDGVRSDTQFIYVNVNDVDEPEGFAITSDGGGDYADLHVAENSLAVTTVAVSGATGPVTYEIVGGAHASWFDIDPESGTLSFRQPPDFETGIYGGSWYYDPYNYPDRYDVTVRASDGIAFDEQEFIITVDDVDEAPVFESFYGAGHVDMIVTENDVDLGYVWASDPDRYSWVTYGLEGPDAAFFQVDPYSGAFSFIEAPDYEAWADADGDNVYEVSVVAYSGMLSASQSFFFTVVDMNEEVVITSDGGGDWAVVEVAENGTAVTTVAAAGAGAVTYEIVGGDDASWFTIDPQTGALSFVYPPNYESKVEGNGPMPAHPNHYHVVVRAGDGQTYDDQLLSVRVKDVDEAPVIQSYASAAQVALTVAENGSAVGTVLARDPERTSVTYAITGGADAALFEVDPVTGVLRFRQAPDFEAPGDSGGNNVYEVTVAAASGTLSASQAFSITVGNVNEAPVIGSAASLEVAEGQTAVTTVSASDAEADAVSFAITGGADAALFAIDAATGALRFVAAPDFEAPADASGDNVYEVEVSASDGQLAETKSLSVAVTDLDPPVALGGEFTVNSTYARTQAHADATRLADGNFIVTWIDADFNTTAGRFLRGQIFAPDGVKIGGELTLASGSSVGTEPAVAALPDGGFVVTWRPLGSVAMQMFDSAGQATSARVTVSNAGSSVGEPQIAALANGGFAITWDDSRSTGTD
ncbi:MAG TPA: cadherin domain-containing protein, partial [Allosphingosinicella sp.]|nr:cadherin domain-containing protein [Allosphingosinicella sp.]